MIFVTLKIKCELLRENCRGSAPKKPTVNSVNDRVT